MKLEQIILGSVMSEKSYLLNEKSTYVLKVGKNSNKEQIKRALKEVFNVDVLSINTLLTRGKIRRKSRSKKSAPISIKLSNTKKAIIRLKSGQTLPVSVLQKNEAQSS